MAKLDLGTKRVCPNCGSKYYDLNKDPIICPKCGTRFEPPARSRAVPAPAVVVEEVKPVEEAPPADVEFISLEEAEEEEAAGAAEEEEEEVEIAGQGEDPFLVDEDEGGDDVTGIIGDVGNEEER